MSLDKNLFTLSFTHATSDSSIVNLVDPDNVIHYVTQRVSTIPYEIRMYDPLSQSLLITANAPNPTSKFKILTLHNPLVQVSLKYVGMISFKWAFQWGEHEFEWRKSECYLLRKPDPPVLVAVTKDTPGRIHFKTVQILDYNLNRFDIDDKKGLELVLLLALSTLKDYSEALQSSPQEVVTSPPPIPPKPEPKTGIERLREMQLDSEEYNQIVVEADGSVSDYGQLCFEILEDSALLFITLRSASMNEVQKVLLVAEEVKRIRYKSGLYEGEELQQYVLYDTNEAVSKGPKRIDLNDPQKTNSKYSPPQNLTVHLSKIHMPELQPHETVTRKSALRENTVPEERPPDKRKEKKEKKKGKDRGKDKNASLRPKPSTNKLNRPRASNAPSQSPSPPQTTPAHAWLGNRFTSSQTPLTTSPPPPPITTSSQFGAVSDLIGKGLESLKRR